MAFESSLLLLPLLFTVFIDIAVGGWILKRNPKGINNQLCFLLFLVLAVWSFGVSMMMISPVEDLANPDNNSRAEMWTWVLYAGGCFIPSAALHFNIVFTKSIKKDKYKYLWLLHLLGFALFPFMNEGVDYLQDSGVYDVAKDGIMFKLFGAYILTAIFISLVLAVRKYLRTRNLVERFQTKYAVVGMIIAGTVTPMISVVLPTLDLLRPPPLGGSAATVMALFFAYSIAKYRLFEIEAVTEEMQPAVETGERLEIGNNYLIKERGTRHSYEIFRGLVSRVPGLCISTAHPAKLRAEYKMEKTPILWLTETATDEKSLNPYRLDFEIMYNIETFFNENEGTVVLLDDPKYLALVNGYQGTVDFLKAINDIGGMRNGTVMMCLDPALFEDPELVQIEGLFDEVIDLSESGGDLDRRVPSSERSLAYLVESESPDKMYDHLGRWKVPSLGLTKTMPKKLANRYDLRDSRLYWMTDAISAGEEALSYSRLDFEVSQTVSEYLRGGGRLVFIDCLDLLYSKNGMDKLHEFLKSVIDIASVNDASIITTVNPRTFNDTDLAILRRRFDVIVGNE